MMRVQQGAGIDALMEMESIMSTTDSVSEPTAAAAVTMKR